MTHSLRWIQLLSVFMTLFVSLPTTGAVVHNTTVVDRFEDLRSETLSCWNQSLIMLMGRQFRLPLVISLLVKDLFKPFIVFQPTWGTAKNRGKSLTANSQAARLGKRSYQPRDKRTDKKNGLKFKLPQFFFFCLKMERERERQSETLLS